MVADDEIIKKVNELIARAKNREDTIRALYEFVCKEIRYVETELIGKKGGYEPAPAVFTFKNKYGVCRDKAGLLVSLLRATGIKESYMVLTNPMILRMESDMPVSSQFNHAIVAVRTDTGFLYLDPTAEQSREFLTPYEDDKPVLVCTEKGEDIAQTPSRTSETNMTELNTEGILSEDGSLNSKIILKGSGLSDYGFRYLCQMFPKEQLEQFFTSMFKSSYPQAVVDSFTFTDPNDFAIPMEIKIYLKIPDFALKIEKEWHLRAGEFSSDRNYAQMWGLSERKYPLYFWSKMATKTRGKIMFPKNLTVKSLPPEFNQKSEFIDCQISFNIDQKTNSSKARVI